MPLLSAFNQLTRIFRNFGTYMNHRNVTGTAIKGAALAVALSATLIAGCGKEPAPREDTRTAAQKKSDEIYNPTPEQKAAQAAERQAAIDAGLPRRVDFTDPGAGDDSAYTDIGATFVAFKVYNAKRTWDETPEDIAKSTLIYQDYTGVDSRIPPIGNKLRLVRDAFERSDAEKQLAAIVSEISQPYKQTQLVKITLTGNVASLMPYDFTAKGFSVAKELFTDKLAYTEIDKKMPTYADPRVEPIKTYVYNLPSDYNIGFTGGAGKTLIKVDDEQLARKIEAARPHANVDFYGYVESVQRRRLRGEDQKERYVMIHVQKVEIKDGKNNEVLISQPI